MSLRNSTNLNDTVLLSEPELFLPGSAVLGGM